MSYSIPRKLALVTGASSGIGRELAKQFAQHGCDLVVARDAFEALMNGDERVVSHSLSTKLQGRGNRVLPDRVKVAMHSRMAEPGSAGDN